MSTFRTWYALPLALLTVLLVAGIWQFSSYFTDAGSPDIRPASTKATESPPWQQFRTAKSARGTAEDPFARKRYEWMRTRDPDLGRVPEDMRSKELSFAKQLPRSPQKSSSWQARGPGNVGGRSRGIAYDVSDPSYETILAAGVSGGIWRTTDGGDSWTRTLDRSQRPNVTTLVQDTRAGERDTWYAGTGEVNGSASTASRAFYYGDGIYKSTDGGQTWAQLPSTDSENTSFDSFFDYVHRVRIDPSNTTADEVYAATYGGIWLSADGGSNWSRVLWSNTADFSDDWSRWTDVAVSSGGQMYAAMSSEGDRRGLWRSNNGTDWFEITPPGWPGQNPDNEADEKNTYRRIVVDISPADESQVWFLAYAPSGCGSAYDSPCGPFGADGDGNKIAHVLWRYDADAAEGNRWTDFSAYLPTRGDDEDQVPGGRSGDFNSQRGYDLLVAAHPSDPSTVFVGGRNLWRLDVSGSSDGADTWIGGYTYTNDSFASYQPTGSDRQHPDQHTVAFHPEDPDIMLTGSDGGIHLTPDNRAPGDGGVKYLSLNDGFLTTQFYQVCMNPDASDPTIMGGMQDNGTWLTASPGLSDWTELSGGDGGECEITNRQNGEGTVFYPSSQNGRTFQFVYKDGDFVSASLAAPPASNQLFIHPFELDAADPTVMYYPDGGALWRNASVESSPDSNWTKFEGVTQTGYVITTLRSSKQSSPHVLYYGATDASGNNRRARIFRLPDAHEGTLSPVDLTADAFPQGAYPSDIAVDPRDSDKVLVAFSNYGVASLFYSKDGGQSWTNVEGNLGGSTGPSVRSVEILPQPALNQTTYYAGTSVGLYSTSTLSASTVWTQEGATTIGSTIAEDVEARNEDGKVLVGTHGTGTYSTSVTVPVELASFDATVDDGTATLTWTTASETNNAEFRIQHSYRDDDFQTIGTVEGSGTTNRQKAYRYETDRLEPGSHAFRLRQVDTDGTARTLDPISVTVSPSGKFELTEAAPNPFRESTTLRLTVRTEQRVRAAVYNSLGQRVQKILDRSLAADEPTDLSLRAEGLSSGVYFVKVRGQTFEATRRVVVTR